MPTFENLFFNRAGQGQRTRSILIDCPDFWAAELDWRDEESISPDRCAGGGSCRSAGGTPGWSLGDGVGSGFGGEAADDVCRSAADEAGQ